MSTNLYHDNKCEKKFYSFINFLITLFFIYSVNYSVLIIFCDTCTILDVEFSGNLFRIKLNFGSFTINCYKLPVKLT